MALVYVFTIIVTNDYIIDSDDDGNDRDGSRGRHWAIGNPSKIRVNSPSNPPHPSAFIRDPL